MSNQPTGCSGCKDDRKTIVHTQTQHFGKPRILADGSILYKKRPKDWEPPPVPEGFARDPKDSWHFLPTWPQCEKRIQTQYVKQCGKVGLLVVCNHPDAPTRQLEVLVDTCKACPFRK